jgi:hypothetical protein
LDRLYEWAKRTIRADIQSPMEIMGEYESLREERDGMLAQIRALNRAATEIQGERDGMAAALETHEIGMRQITRRLLGWTEAFPSAEAFQDCRSIVNDCKACMESRTILAARDARNKAEGRAEGLREAANELTPAIPSPIGPLHAAGMMFCVEHLRKMAAQAEGKNHA